SFQPRSRVPSSSRESSPSDEKGSGVVSHAMGSSAGAAGAEGLGACAWCAGLPRRGAPRDRRRGPWGEWLLSVVFEVQLGSLACAEGEEAADRIVRRHADGPAISRNHLDAEAAHAAAELRQHLVSRVALHPVQAATVHSDDSALHVDQIVLAQLLAFLQTTIMPHRRRGPLRTANA